MSGRREDTVGRINVLGFDVANLIAAGEVVDRPASVVKELCENAIDAGASAITVEIRHGGTSLIRVSDNGCGIERDDMPLTVLRHATSKIATAEDLASIGTLGFRGEALAAIAAVCKLKMYSRLHGEAMGCIMYCEGGEIVDITDTGCAVGTTVVASELFYNVPARRKFLKKDASECAAVSAAVEKIALSVPNISVQYITDGELRFKTVGDGDLRGAIYSVYGKAVASRMTAVNRVDSNGIRVSGYVGEPDLVRANKNSENFFINSRFVKSRTAMAALEQAFATRIPSSKFPVCVLNIQLNPAAVDVNVHPSKLEVKFANERIIFEAVYYAVLNALQNSADRPEMKIVSPFASSYGETERNRAADIYNRAAHTGESSAAGINADARITEPPHPDKSADEVSAADVGDSRKDGTIAGAGSVGGAEKNVSEPSAAAYDGACGDKPSYVAYKAVRGGRDPLAAFVPVERDREDIPRQIAIDAPAAEKTVGAAQSTVGMSDSADIGSGKNSFAADEDINKSDTDGAEASDGSRDESIPEYTILGEAYNCYVILQLADRLLIVDKHAAHERILFDELCRRMKEKERRSQILMFPITVSISEDEIPVLDEYGDSIKSIGFAYTFDAARRELNISEIPQELGRDAAKDMMEELLSSLSASSGTIETTQAKYFEAKLYQASCKAAVKGGRVYGEQHIRWICDRLLKAPGEDGAVIKTCPHGRPVAFEIKKSSIDRQFDRIM